MSWFDRNEVPFSDLVGKTLTNVHVINSDEEIIFIVADGSRYRLSHHQDCCESVYIESVTGDIADLIGTPILKAEEVTSGEHPEGYKPDEYDRESFTWTFYKLATIKGYVDIRWFGSSNGYYSERVDFERIAGPDGQGLPDSEGGEI